MTEKNNSIKSNKPSIKKEKRWQVSRPICFAGIISGVVLVASIAMFQYVVNYQQEEVTARLNHQVKHFVETIKREMEHAIRATQRMGYRWEVSGGTSEAQWREEAKRYVDDFIAVTAVEWVDSKYYVRWVEPVKGNEKAIGLDIAFDEARRNALDGAAKKGKITLTPPLNLMQGYRAFISYVPIFMEDKFNGFIVSIYSPEKLLKGLINAHYLQKLNIQVKDGNEIVFQSVDADAFTGEPEGEQVVALFNRAWSVKVSPKSTVFEAHAAFLPWFILLVGSVMASLVGILTYNIMASEQRNKSLVDKTKRLTESEERLNTILSTAPNGIIITESTGVILSANQAIKDILGYEEEELVGQNVNMLVPQEHRVQHPSYVAQYIESFKRTGEGKVMAGGRNIQGVHKDGSLVLLEIGLNGIYAPDGAVQVVATLQPKK